MYTVSLSKRISQWPTPVRAVLVGGIVFLSKLPWVFTTLGEQDHARLILAAMVYAQDGVDTIRPYAILTSPLWSLPISWLSHWWSAPQLVLFSNVVGWLAGAAVAGISLTLLRQLGCGLAWSVSGALAVTWIPGAFYTSLYGYPSQWALPLLLASAAAFLRCLDAAQRRAAWTWFVLAGVLFCLLVLMKVDFALMGTLLLGIAVLRDRLRERWTLMLPIVAAVSGGVALLASRLLVAESSTGFASGWMALYPGESSSLVDPISITTLYSVGLGTMLLWTAAVVVGLLRRSTRRAMLRLVVAWVVAVWPLWLFWMSRPPMSSRHALPGAVVTVLLAAQAASLVWGRRPRWAVVWLVLLIGINATLRSQSFDFNYRPSGDLMQGADRNRRAFAVATHIADRISEPVDRTKILLGRSDPDILSNLDLLPFIEYAMASQSTQVRCLGRIGQKQDHHMRDLVFTAPEGRETKLLRGVDPRRVGLYRGEGVGFYAPWGLQGATVNVLGVEVVEFDPVSIYETMFDG
jgi:hypothetical protein